MADCNSIESLLNQLLDKLDTEGIDGSIGAIIAQILAKNIQQDLAIAALQIQLLGLGEDGGLSNRVTSLERVVDSILRTVGSLNTRLKKLQNDFNFAVKRFTTRFNGIDKKLKELDNKNRQQDKKNTDQDNEINLIKAAIAALFAGGGAIFLILKRLLLLEAKERLIDNTVDNIKKLLGDRKNQKGEKGDKGDKGDKGAKGDGGQKGDKGEIGQKGDSGNNGQKGDKGEIGQKGEKGIKGDTGNRGSTGEKGSIGSTGRNGTNGTDGSKGDRGDKGERGDKGIQGIEGQVKIVQTEKTVIVYREPDFTDVLAKILELRNRLIFDSTVDVSSSCDTSIPVTTNDLPEFLNAMQDKLTSIEKLICDKENLESYDLGTFSQTVTVSLSSATRFIKIEVIDLPSGIGKRFSRVDGEPDSYMFGSVAFTSPYGLKPEIDWKWLNSYFTPDVEDNPTKFHIYPAYLGITYKLTGYRAAV